MEGKYTLGEVAKMTGVNRKTLQRWVSPRKEKNKSKNQNLFQVEITPAGYHIFNREDISKVMRVNLYRDFGLDYQEIKGLLQEVSSLSDSLKLHRDGLENQISNSIDIIFKINLILNETDSEKQFDLVNDLSRHLSPSTEGIQHIEEKLLILKKALEKYSLQISEVSKEKQKKGEKIVFTTEEKATINKSLNEAQKLLEKIIAEKIYVKTRALNMNLGMLGLLVAFPENERTRNSFEVITEDNSLFLSFFETSDGATIKNLGTELYTINNLVLAKRYDFPGYSYGNSEIEIEKKLSFCKIRDQIKSCLRVPYLCLEDHHDGYPLFHKLYQYGDLKNLKKIATLNSEKLNRLDKYGKNVLDYAIEKKDVETISFFFKLGMKPTGSNIYEASKSDDTETFKAVIGGLEDIPTQYFLHSLILNDFQSVSFFMQQKYSEITKHFINKFKENSIFLIYKTLKINKCPKTIKLFCKHLDDENKTNLMYIAIDDSNTEFVKTALKQTDVNLKTGYQSFLGRALATHNYELIEFLVHKGASPNSLEFYDYVGSKKESFHDLHKFVICSNGEVDNQIKVLSMLHKKGMQLDLFERFNNETLMDIVAMKWGSFRNSYEKDSSLQKIAGFFIEHFADSQTKSIFLNILQLDKSSFLKILNKRIKTLKKEQLTGIFTFLSYLCPYNFPPPVKLVDFSKVKKEQILKSLNVFMEEFPNNLLLPQSDVKQ